VHLSYQHKNIILDKGVRSCFQANGTSTYVSNYIVCFKCFLIVSVRYISYGGFQTKVYKLIAVIVYARLKWKSWFIVKNSVSLISLRSWYYALRRWTHFFTYTDVANPHNRINDIPLAAGTPIVVTGVIDVHLRYYDRSSPRRS